LKLKLFRPDGSFWPASDPVTVETSKGQIVLEAQGSGNETAGEFLVRPRADLPEGPFADAISIRPSAGHCAVQVRVQGQVVPSLLISPNVLYFDDIDPRSGPAKRYVVGRRTDGQDVARIVRSTAPAAIRLEELVRRDSTTAKHTMRLQVTLDPGEVTEELDNTGLSLWLEGEAKPLTVLIRVALRDQLGEAKP
jgi:hypothetical protein